MKEIVFVTHNKGKIASAKRELKDINFSIFEYELDEPRSEDIKYISKAKVMEAYQIVKKPCISLDCGFWIDELQGFPKAFVNFALDTIGIKGILKLMEDKENRDCRFTECLSYYDGNKLHQFMGKHEGNLSKEIIGIDTDKRWSDLWYIFIPKGYKKTLAQMTDEERDLRNTEKENNEELKEYSISAMDEFVKWYKNEVIN